MENGKAVQSREEYSTGAYDNNEFIECTTGMTVVKGTHKKYKKAEHGAVDTVRHAVSFYMKRVIPANADEPTPYGGTIQDCCDKGVVNLSYQGDYASVLEAEASWTEDNKLTEDAVNEIQKIADELTFEKRKPAGRKSTEDRVKASLAKKAGVENYDELLAAIERLKTQKKAKK